MADVVGSLAGVLRHHLTALDSTDEASKPEFEAYQRLIRENEQIAGLLRSLADQMSGYRSLPLANHDMDVLQQPPLRETFEALVNAKHDLRHLLEEHEIEDAQMLEQMPG